MQRKDVSTAYEVTLAATSFIGVGAALVYYSSQVLSLDVRLLPFVLSIYIVGVLWLVAIVLRRIR
ncbi:MAG: hypothetical protein ABIA93_00270 [Candidatus Woesearchaeota archaeon]